MMISNITSDIYGTLSQAYSNSLFLPMFILVEDQDSFLSVTFFAWLLCCEKRCTHLQKKTQHNVSFFHQILCNLYSYSSARKTGWSLPLRVKLGPYRGTLL